MNLLGKYLICRTLIITTVSVTVLLFLFVVGYATNVFLVFFISVLFALFLRGISHYISKHTLLSDTLALAIVFFSMSTIIVAGGWLLASKIEQQMSALSSELPKAAKHLEEQIQQYEWGRHLFRDGPALEPAIQKLPDALSAAGLVVSSAFGVLVDIVVVLFVGLYLASNPELYIGGLLHLLPQHGRTRAREVLFTIGNTLQRWLLGRLILMGTNGLVTMIGLALLGIPLPVPLGIIAGLLNFIPNLGPIIAAIPTLLIASLQRRSQALYVLIFYVGYQMLDGYVLTPIVQKRTISIPPALTIMAQVLLGVLLGTVGILVAVPLLAMAMVLVRMLYLEDVLKAHQRAR